jgi:glycosyltransferase involved in cell wall biosynthesis
LSIAVIEAMAHGLPCLVPDVGDMRDLVVDGENGFMFQELDYDSVSQRLTCILKDIDEYRVMSLRARRSTMRYSLASCAAKWSGLLNKILAKQVHIDSRVDH